MRVGSRLVAASLVWIAATGEVPSAAADTPALAPHRAVYDISLVDARPGAGVAELTGRMVYELTGSACAGYTQKMRFVTRSTSQEGETTVSDMRLSSWEDGAGSRFRFNNSQFRDDRQTNQTVGEAVRRTNPGELRVELTKPKKRVIKVPGEPMFPIQHSINLLKMAQAGKSVYTADLYDASEKGEKVYATNAYIGGRHAPGHNKSLSAVPNSEPLNELASWPVALSYYERGKELEDAVPSYEIAFLIFENGVSRRLLIDYGNFSIRGELKELAFMEPEKCSPTPARK